VKGERHYNHKLTRVQALGILRAHRQAEAEGKTWGFQTRMSKQFNTAVSTINNVVQRRSWKEITEDEIRGLLPSHAESDPMPVLATGGSGGDSAA